MSNKLHLSDGRLVLKSDYVTAKTKDLIEFGYAKLKESEVSDEVDKILKGESRLSVIGHFCKDDIDVPLTNKA